MCNILQAFGLAVLMAKAGLAVPAAAPVRLPPFSAVLADIGDEQSLSASLSTFSGHLKRIQVSLWISTILCRGVITWVLDIEYRALRVHTSGFRSLCPSLQPYEIVEALQGFPFRRQRRLHMG